jgi:hypothetical protein
MSLTLQLLNIVWEKLHSHKVTQSLLNGILTVGMGARTVGPGTWQWVYASTFPLIDNGHSCAVDPPRALAGQRFSDQFWGSLGSLRS